jgi:hypothetical protein
MQGDTGGYLSLTHVSRKNFGLEMIGWKSIDALFLRAGSNTDFDITDR